MPDSLICSVLMVQMHFIFFFNSSDNITMDNAEMNIYFLILMMSLESCSFSEIATGTCNFRIAGYRHKKKKEMKFSYIICCLRLYVYLNSYLLILLQLPESQQ